MLAGTSSFLAFALASLLATTPASADLAIHRRRPEIVVNPKILTPQKGEVWFHGQTQTVTWSTSSIPAEYASANSTVYLGYLPKHSKTGNEHLKWELASGFPLSAGNVSFVVPENTPPRDDYIVVLLGDSGNRSPRFAIRQAEQWWQSPLLKSDAPHRLGQAPPGDSPEPSQTLVLATLSPGSSPKTCPSSKAVV